MGRKSWLIVSLALTLAAALGATGLTSAQSKGTIAKIKERGELRVGAGVYPPFVIRKPDGSYQGIDIDLTHKLAESLGVKVAYSPQGWDTIVVGLASGKYELIMALCKTAERAKVIDYSEPYFDLAGVYAVRKDNPKKPQALADLNKPDVTIVTPTGAWGEKVAKKYTPNAKIKTIPGATDPDLLQEVLSGRADAYPADTPVQSALIRAQHGDLMVFIPDEAHAVEGTPVAYGLPKGDDEWRAYVNKFLENEKKNMAMAALFKKWLLPEYIKPAN
jgi:ABC-type amino acid transport substrate-binding protein